MVSVVLEKAGVEALTELYPGWRIWSDDQGWHARREGMYIQDYHYGAPAFAVHASSAAELAVQLRWQRAAEAHAPFGCPRR
jgi:hypothetical protein